MNKNHHKHQIKYFDKEFSGMQEYSLAAWQKSYILRIKKYMLGKEYKGKTLIDIATGSGYIAVEMAKLGMKVYATDLSPQSLRNLEKFKKQFNLTNLVIIACKAENIPLKDKIADYIVANAILEHIPQEEKTIKEWKRLLRKDGKMLITVPLKFRYVWPFLWPINFIHDKRIGHLRRYDLSDLKTKFKMETVAYFYTGHLIKVLGIARAFIFKTNKFEAAYEKKDAQQYRVRYGANNISVIFTKK